MKHFYVCLAVLVTCILTACSEGEVALKFFQEQVVKFILRML